MPVDENVEVAVVGGPLKRYKVTMPGGVETVMKLNKADAERLGGEPLEPEAAQPVEEEPSPKPAAKKRAAPANKARTARNKGGAGGGDD